MELEYILKQVNDSLEIDINTSTRKRDFVQGRFLFMKLAKELNPRVSYSKIGQVLKKNHATVMHGIKTMDDIIKFKQDKELINTYNEMYNELNNQLIISKTRFDRTKMIVQNQEPLRKYYA